MELKSFVAPTKPGKYWYQDRFSKAREMLTVIVINGQHSDNLRYLGVIEKRNCDVRTLRGIWSDQIK